MSLTATSSAGRADAEPSAAPLFHALSDATRLRILEFLRAGERCVCELQGALDTAQSLLSFHLKTLRDAGLVTYRKEGRWAYYGLSKAGLRDAHDAVARLRRPKGRRRPVNCCE